VSHKHRKQRKFGTVKLVLGNGNVDLLVMKTIGFHEYTNEIPGYIKPNTVADRTSYK
jgi:hypothetical protein